MELNIVTFLYLFFRLAPFILVSFFSLSSLFNQDFKGLVYLIGLIFTCFTSIMIGNAIPNDWLLKFTENNEICNMITVGNNSNALNIPIGQTILGYTFFYLLYAIIKYKSSKHNIPTLVFFPLIILLDAFWNITNRCYSLPQILVALGLGIGFGLLWGLLIDKTKISSLQYFNKISGKEICSVPSKQTFQCKVYKNGKLLSNM